MSSLVQRIIRAERNSIRRVEREDGLITIELSGDKIIERKASSTDKMSVIKIFCAEQNRGEFIKIIINRQLSHLMSPFKIVILEPRGGWMIVRKSVPLDKRQPFKFFSGMELYE